MYSKTGRTVSQVGLAFTLIFVSSSCGYHLQGNSSILPPDVKTVAIPLAENDTTESALSLQLTEALRSRFERYGVVKVVDNPASADAILHTKILNVTTRVRSVTGRTDTALEQELLITLSGELKKRGGQVLWRNPSISASQSFASVSNVVVTSSSSFATGNIGSDTLSSLDSREVSRGQKDQTLGDLVEEAARKLYLEAVAADF